jgi:hypothetical protein
MNCAGRVVIAALTLLASVARADIYEWSDASGARHFTNDKRGVPAEYQDVARLFVSDWSHPAESAPVAESPPAEQPPQAQVATDLSGLEQAYAAGLRDALQLTGGAGGGGGGVQINGPLAVASTRPAQNYGGYPMGLYPPWPWYYPFVTTGFDGGRSRHQTLRMLLQDQFAIDRDGPFAYERWDQPGIGPALAPFLPRGLPYGVGQFGRVIFR